MNSYTFPFTMTYTVTYIKTLPAPSVKKLLREAGYTQGAVAALHGCRQSVVSRTIRKQISSRPVWERIAWCLNHPRREQVVA